MQVFILVYPRFVKRLHGGPWRAPDKTVQTSVKKYSCKRSALNKETCIKGVSWLYEIFRSRLLRSARVYLKTEYRDKINLSNN